MKREMMYNILLLVGAVAVFFVIFEVVLHLADIQTGQRDNEFMFYEYNETLGWKNKIGVEGEFHFADGSNYVRVNKNGLRDEDYGYNKTRKRIVVLGDSHTWGFGINDSQRYSEILERELGVEVINMGVAGYGTDQEYLTLMLEGARYKPDLVVVGFHAGSDLDDNSADTRYSYPKPRFVLDDGKLTLTNVPVPRKEDWERREFLNDSFYRKIDRVSHRYFLSYAFFRGRLLNVGVVRGWLLRKEVEKQLGLEQQEKMAITLALLKEMDYFVDSINAELIVVIIPTRGQVYADGSTYQNNILTEFGRKDGIKMIDLLHAFKERRDEGLYFTIDPHWNAAGNKAAAEEIKAYIEQQDLLE